MPTAYEDPRALRVSTGTGNRKYQLLLVEDSRSDARLFKEALNTWGTRHPLIVVEDGEAALDVLSRPEGQDGSRRPDLIFLDLNLPKMDGFEILKRIRRHENPAVGAIPVIVFTSSSLPRDIERAYELGANAFITKPSDFHEFCRTLARVASFWFGIATLPQPSSIPMA